MATGTFVAIHTFITGLIKQNGFHISTSDLEVFPTMASILYLLHFCVQMEEEERARIQRMKDEECARAVKELEAWKEKKRVEEEEEEVAAKETEPIRQHRKAEKVLTPGPNSSRAEGKKKLSRFTS